MKIKNLLSFLALGTVHSFAQRPNILILLADTLASIPTGKK